MIRLEHHRVRVGNMSIAYQATGAGKPIVLVHGLSGSGRWWARNIHALAERFRVYVVDLIGFGASRGPQRFVLSEASDYLVRWLDMVGLDRPHLVGHSMGGFIVAETAAEHPNRVDRLVLVAPAVLPFQARALVHARNLVHTGLGLPVGFLPILALDVVRSGPFTLWRAGRQLLSAELSTKLPEIDAPILVVWGERDRLVPVDHAQRLTRVLPASQLFVVPGAGHNPMWDRPKIFNRVVVEFLTQPLASR